MNKNANVVGDYTCDQFYLTDKVEHFETQSVLYGDNHGNN